MIVPLVAWILVGALATACGFFVLLGVNERKAVRLLLQVKDAVIADLKARNETLLATALEAKGQMLIDPNAPPRQVATVKASTLRSVPQRIRELEEEDRRKAIEMQASAVSGVEPG